MRVSETGCWEWLAKAQNGRACIKIGRKVRAASRVAYEEYNGSIPDGLLVRHTCDNGMCVNPSHLILGTHADNMEDMRVRGRASREPSGKVTATMLCDILALTEQGWTNRKIADHLNVTSGTVTYHLRKNGIASDRHAHAKGKDYERRKPMLTYEQAKEACLMKLRGMTYVQISNHFGCSESLPREVFKGRTWAGAADEARAMFDQQEGRE